MIRSKLLKYSKNYKVRNLSPTRTFCSRIKRHGQNHFSFSRNTIAPYLQTKLYTNNLVSVFSTRSAISSEKQPSRSVEEIYQKKTPLEHILLRPGMYIGSVESGKDSMWIKESTKDTTEPSMSKQSVEYTPALYKVFDEILVNAVDNKARDKSMNALYVTIDRGSEVTKWKPWISIYNNGRGIPIKFHKDEQVYVPELVLGHLLTGSNFDDTTSRLTGGRHGYGAKLTNIFSTEFIVETGDSKSSKKYRQVWKENMKIRCPPDISSMDSNEESFTKITFSPDLNRFGMTKLSEGMIKVLEKRTWDVAGCLSGVQVYLNGNAIPIQGFRSYIDAFKQAVVDTEQHPLPSPVYARPNNRWEVGVLPSDIGHDQISFVNGMSTLRGGTHVNYITEQITRRIADYINKKYTELKVTPAQVKAHFIVFINCMIENPTFDSQMKEFMSSKTSTYGSICFLSESFSKQLITSSGIVERVVNWAQMKQRSNLINRLGGNKKRNTVNVPKLEDANLAGGKDSDRCKLILTEGDSAKALAVSGFAVIGRDTYGVFPLRGKFLNVRDATVKQLSENKELGDICTILGLDFDETYDTPESRSKLRYGGVLLMTDQDHDGSHIKGLIINLFHYFWPKLVESGYLSQFITPIIKANSGKDSLSFYSLPEYYKWSKSMSLLERSKWSIKYYKGLGTSSSKEAREYFSNLDKHILQFQWNQDLDGELIDMVFRKNKVEQRKNWLLNEYKSDQYIDTRSKVVTYEDFVNKELIQFSHSDNIRSIPSMIDGLKPSQRKVLYASFKRRLNKEIKVAQLAGYCSEHTGYHHGEVSLHSTITGMAQGFVGSNNIPLLFPSGQFGTRLQGGKDSASARYIFTKLGPYTRYLFPEIDDQLLTYKDDDGLRVEPEFYVPILPLILVNGSEGIGTGWSTSIPKHNPIEIIDILLQMLEDKKDISIQMDLTPWSKGFKGKIEKDSTSESKFTSSGVIHIINKTTLEILELPIGVWVEDYKNYLLKLISKNDIKEFKEYHTESKVRFVITLPRNKALKPDIEPNDLIKNFKLQNNINIGNMHAFDHLGRIKKYSNVMDILQDFHDVRLSLYQRRKDFIVDKTELALLKLKNRIRFQNEISTEKLEITKKNSTKLQLVEKLKDRGYDKASRFMKSKSIFDDNQNIVVDPSTEYDYLLNTSLLSFTLEHVAALERDYIKKESYLNEIKHSSIETLWANELKLLRSALVKDGFTSES